MKVVRKIKRSNFFIKLKSWEFWPFGIVQLPAIIYWLWLSLRSRSLVFFSASNPGIPMGGMFGESKYGVLKTIPAEYVPKTILINLPANTFDLQVKMRDAALMFPVIFKPDLGERGFMVRRIDTEKDIDTYLRDIKINFLIQELVELPLEFGIFYKRIPGQEKGEVISVVAKEMLSVEGDGKSTLKELIFDSDRAKLQWEKLQFKFQDQLLSIIPSCQKVELVSIGNHAVGTTFLNANHLINKQLHETFNGISKAIPGFYFGRFDLRCASLKDLFAGKVSIIELNGCGAEPAHIYDPSFSFWVAVRVLIIHWHTIFSIARENKKLGIQYTGFREAWALYRKFKAVTK